MVVALEDWSVGVVVAIVLGAIEGRTIGTEVVGEQVGFVGDALGILVGVVGAAVGLGTGAVMDPLKISRNAALKDVKFICTRDHNAHDYTIVKEFLPIRAR